MENWIEKIGVIASVILPLFNIPLIANIVKRKSSADISVPWAVGVWTCIVFMTPQTLRSEDIAFKTFGIMNIFFFSAVTYFVLKYRNKSSSPNSKEKQS